MNKNAYNRYIEKTDPLKHQEREEYIEKTQKYKSKILDITRRFIDNPDLQITTEMNDMFSDYCKTCIKYFELKDLEESCRYEDKKKEDDDNSMFYDEMDDSSVRVNPDTLYSKCREPKYTAFH
jgi:hypothetical protein